MTEEPVTLNDGDDIEAATAIRTGPRRQRLRAAIEIEHVCTFFAANALYQIKSDETTTKVDSKEFEELEMKEESMYERAKALRKELLIEIRKKADAVTSKIDEKARQHSLVEIPRVQSLKEFGGIESRRYFEKIESMITILQRQATQLQEWRDKTVRLLLLPLVDEESTELQGDEYENSAKAQDEVYVYVDLLEALIADRHEMVTGQVNGNVSHAMAVALKQAKESQGHSPELFQRLILIRNQLKPPEGRSVRALLMEIRELKTTLRQSTENGNTRAAAELLLVNGALTKLTQISNEQTKAVTGLEREIDLLKDAMNLRLEYYKQLQAISDTVAPYEVDMTEEARNFALLAKIGEESRLKARLATMKARARYLVHLRREQSNAESQKLCIICQSSFEITYKPQELIIEEEAQPVNKDKSVATGFQDATIYSGIRDTTLNQIKNIDMDGSFGTKIDTLARHVLWIREHDPGAKCIVFSQFRDFLEVLSRAFTHFKIGWTGIDRKNGIEKFKDDPSQLKVVLSRSFKMKSWTVYNKEIDLPVEAEMISDNSGRLAKNLGVAEKVLSALSIIFAVAGTCGLILLSIFDTLHHPHLHDGFLLLFIAGYVISAIFICAEYQRLGVHFRQHRILRLSFWMKLVFIITEVCLAIVFAATTFDKEENVAAVFEWTIALIFTFYVLTFFVDLLPAARSTQAHSNDEIMHMKEAENGTSMVDNSAGYPDGYANGVGANNAGFINGHTANGDSGYTDLHVDRNGNAYDGRQFISSNQDKPPTAQNF
ncbi:hypothetical protein P7C71_g105, partial [Lecanoromycetidae sp. Uapishka_2]